MLHNIPTLSHAMPTAEEQTEQSHHGFLRHIFTFFHALAGSKKRKTRKPSVVSHETCPTKSAADERKHCHGGAFKVIMLTSGIICIH